jgi:hypothetical protein
MQQHDNPQLSRCGAREYFQGAVKNAVCNQNFAASDAAIVYLVNLLLNFLRSERLFDNTPDGLTIRPLAVIRCEALSTDSERDRDLSLQRLGDIALFVTGLYAQSLSRSPVDVDYYIAMGEHAYGYLAECRSYVHKSGDMRLVFDELSGKFSGFVEILSEVGAASNLSGNTDILRLYELWQYSGSDRLAKKLRQLGIQPVKTLRCAH